MARTEEGAIAHGRLNILYIL